MKYPEFLKEKGTIGFVAPSCGCATSPYKEAFQNALCKWETSGYQFDLGSKLSMPGGGGHQQYAGKVWRGAYKILPEKRK